MNCWSCQADNPASAKFCFNCGSRLVADPATEAPCRSCAAPLPLDARFCGYCGTPDPIAAAGEPAVEPSAPLAPSPEAPTTVEPAASDLGARPTIAFQRRPPVPRAAVPSGGVEPAAPVVASPESASAMNRCRRARMAARSGSCRGSSVSPDRSSSCGGCPIPRQDTTSPGRPAVPRPAAQRQPPCPPSCHPPGTARAQGRQLDAASDRPRYASISPWCSGACTSARICWSWIPRCGCWSARSSRKWARSHWVCTSASHSGSARSCA
ncbi:MAG: zinc ribbon domain-containing protein [Myxococcales bacterium]|nr:zinc ribbon domain-containing protein [Myxococcales bacterium]